MSEGRLVADVEEYRGGAAKLLFIGRASWNQGIGRTSTPTPSPAMQAPRSGPTSQPIPSTTLRDLMDIRRHRTPRTWSTARRLTSSSTTLTRSPTGTVEAGDHLTDVPGRSVLLERSG